MPRFSPVLLLLLCCLASSSAFPVASPSRLVWIRCEAEDADCHLHPICHLRCEGTVNGRQRASFRAGPVPRFRDDGGSETWLRRQLERLPEEDRVLLFGTGVLEIFLELSGIGAIAPVRPP